MRTDNNLGAETILDYATSTRFYLQDKRDGKPWLTRLPFPVHVVERVETWDHISRSRFVSRYAYHHGYFDGEEREFRGFGMVEQWDTEEFGTLADCAVAADNVAEASHVPPIHTKTWFHTGAWLGRDRIADCFDDPPNTRGRGEYFREPGLSEREARALLLPDTPLPAGLTLDEEREASRALAGAMLRQEVYADDAGPGAAPWQAARACTPYTVTEQNFHVRLLQGGGCNRHAVFLTHANEALNYHYERNPADPRIGHALTLEVDAWGNVLKQAAIGYGRRREVRAIDRHGKVCDIANPGFAGLDAADQARQTTALLTYTENRFTNAVESTDMRRLPQPSESITFELTGYPASGPAGRYQAADFVDADPACPGGLRHRFTAPQVAYEDLATGCRRRRAIEALRTLYRRDDLCGLLPLGELQARALPGESYKLAFTPGLLASVFQRPCAGQAGRALLPDPASVLGGQGGDQGGYVASQTLKADGLFPACDADDHWWIPSGRSFFGGDAGAGATDEMAHARQHFYLPRRYRDAFGQDTFVDYDKYDLLTRETRDALGNRITVEANDYRVLKPRLVSDPNRNQSEVAYDTLGLVAGSAVMGKPLPCPVEGDSLAGFVADLSDAERDAFFTAADPRAMTPILLRDATTRVVYDLHRFRRSREADPGDPTRWQPAWAATLMRETHASAPLPPHGLRIQLGFSYSDGFGREIQKKNQAEPGPLLAGGCTVNPRWVGSGWTIFNNKGKPVRQYEPFFSATHAFEYGVQAGVSPVLFYDPAGRVVATLYPNHTYDKVLFDPWRQTSYDVNDTCAPRNAQSGDPRTDPDIAGYVERHFAAMGTDAQDWRTWHAERIGGALGPHERVAAERAAAHADTPTTAHADALGRTVLTVTHNRVVCSGHVLDGTEEWVATRVELDIEGNQRAVLDERKLPIDYVPVGPTEQRVVMRYVYDMLGNRIHQLSMDAGARWMLNDVVGKPIRAWDSRGHNFTTAYDALRRPIRQTVAGSTADSDPCTLHRTIVVDKIDYGESMPNAEALNLRTRVLRHFDSAGVAINAGVDTAGTPVEAYDFKGNLLRGTRRLAGDYTCIPDWGLAPQLDTESFESSTRYDALNRPIQSIAPHSSLAHTGLNVIQSVFNDANLLERMDVWLEHGAEPLALLDPECVAPSPVGVANIDYDAKGQRQCIYYKNGAATRYKYDTLTFRLTQLVTRRSAVDFPADEAQSVCGWPGRQLQNLHYTYDPAGNITHLQDDAQQAVYFRNRRVEPSNDYVYDALYRVIQACGREHLGQTGGEPNPPTAPGAHNAFHTRLSHPSDGNAMGAYTERYVYDAVGNFLQMQHRGSAPSHAGWTRAYDYLEPNAIESAVGLTLKTSNRLTATRLKPNGTHPPRIEPYQFDTHGNMMRMPHLGGHLPGPNMHWDYKDQLHQTDLGGGVAHYVYDASGQRVRKVWKKAPGLTEERIYLGGFEIYRRNNGAIGATTATLERETLHLMAGKQSIALVETRTRDTAGNDAAPRQLIRNQFGNHLSSSSLELDEHAQIISYEEYAPYGSSTYQSVRCQMETAKRYRYTGKERDAESGLYYHGARYYAAWLGRWTACDRAGLIDGPNLYEFVLCNPVKRNDPSGNQGNAPQEFMLGMMWSQMGREVKAMIEGVFGGHAYVDPARNRLDYSGPSGGVGGVVGGVIRAGTLRAVPIEERPSPSSLTGMEIGAGLVPVLDPGARLVTGTTVTGLDTSRGWAALQLAVDVLPFALEAHAMTVETRTMAAAAEGANSSVSLAFRPGRPIGHNMVGVNTGAGTEWSHLVVGSPAGPTSGSGRPIIVTGGDAFVTVPRGGAPGSGYITVDIPVTQADAARAAQVAHAQIEVERVGSYGLFRQDCTTYACSILQAAGVPMPRVSTPALNAVAAAMHAPSAVGPLRIAAVGAAAFSTGMRVTALEEKLQASLPSEHGTALEDRLRMSLPSEH
ncbi:toxin TcdB middle/C-terminal domain-containing protein [Massilia frigida]|uniref:toxin TcdB middle/C-terminal domain-containing protein n=1 Tax=Massilia frigida TaxID=2609281 RepID=UPI001CB6E47E